MRRTTMCTKNWKKCATHIARFSLFVAVALITRSVEAQNMPHEVGLLGAHQGQLRLEPESQSNHGFFQNADIGHLYFSFASNGVQSLAVFIESAAETRSREGLWSDAYIGGQFKEYPASIEERVGLTVLGLETTRSIATAGDFRLGGTIGLGYGFGGADATVKKLGTDSVAHYTSAFSWQAFLVSLSLRVRYTVAVVHYADIGIIAGVRYWGYPYLGPVAGSANYNGPDFRNANDLGYIAGIAIGF